MPPRRSPEQGPVDPGRLFAGHPFALAVLDRIRVMVASIGETTIRETRTQVVFRRRRGFAYLWLPVGWARRPGVIVVLSIALDREIASPRWKQVAHPARGTWMHHLEVRALADLDAEVEGWLREAYAGAG